MRNIIIIVDVFVIDVLDYVSMGLIAVRLTSNVIHNASYILVFELICGLQSADQRSGKSGKGGVTDLNPASSGVCEQARKLVSCNDYDIFHRPQLNPLRSLRSAVLQRCFL